MSHRDDSEGDNERPPETEKATPARGDASALSGLRSRIDAIDRNILEQLANRLAIVGEVAELKQAEGMRIRDFDRERFILRDRMEQASELGFPPTVVESIYRLLLLASRDRQSSLLTRQTPTESRRTVAVIGGEGAMGASLVRLFDAQGHRVLVADLHTELRPEEAARSADIVLISVPIRDTVEVVRTLGPLLREDALLTDVTSLKQAPMEAMLTSTAASVLGMHPMFGPGVHTLEGQRIVLCPGRGEAWYSFMQAALARAGLVVTESTPEAHDRAMAVVQVLNHFQTQVLGLSLSRVGQAHQDTLRFTSPAYLLETYITARHFAQSPELYGPIEMLNPSSKQVTECFVAAAQEITDIIATGDQARFDSVFEEVRSFFGPFTKEAEEQSSFLIDRLVELSTGEAVR